MAEIPESILRRSAEARAKAEGRSVDEVLAEMKGEAAPPPAAPEPAAPAAASGEAAQIPEALLRRTAEARAKKEGRSVEEVMAELTGAAPPAPPAAAPEPAAPAAASGEAAQIPEALLRRTAEARAKKEGRSVEEVMAELTGAAPPPAAPEPAAPAAAAAPTGGGSGLPEHLVRRSAEARAKREGRSVDEVMAELVGATPVGQAPVGEAVVADTPPAAQPAAAAPAPVAAPAPTGPVRDLDAESATYGVPVPLLQRAMVARARRDGTAVPTMAGATPAPTAAAVPAAGGAAAAAAPAAAPAIPEGVRTQRLLTVVKAGAIQQVKSEPHDKVSVWPHLLAIEFVALMVVLAALFVFSVFVDAPLLEFANFNEQPNPSKAPWYFLGLQELLSYFDPQVAGIIVPTFGAIGLALIPYVDRNPSVRPSDRKLAIMIFSFFLFAAAVLTIYGSFFRGPGFNFTFPWVDGVFFDF